MFVLREIEDTLPIKPHLLQIEAEAIEYEITKKYINKILPNVGLCIKLFDLLFVGEGIIYPGEPSPYFKVIFRMVIFRPFVGEIIVGKVKDLSAEGIQVTLDFFEDILIPSSLFLQPSTYEESGNNHHWIWTTSLSEYQEEDEKEEEEEEEKTGSLKKNVVNFYMMKGQKIRFRVEALQFGEKPNERPPKKEGPQKVQIPEKKVIPMQILGSISVNGLGPIEWW